MNNSAVTMPSITAAMKAKRLLSNMGYKCNVKRLSVSSEKGCTHYISVNTSQETLLRLLKANYIKYGEIITEAVTP